MAPRQSQGRASFFWQGLFILLPVAIMAGIALTALLRDRAAAEREARQRAEELLQEVDNGFDRALGFQLSRFAGGDYDRLWTQQHLVEAALWPGSSERRKAEQERRTSPEAHAEAEAALTELARVSGGFPGDFMPTELSFTADGRVNSPSDAAREASPPAWVMALSATQLQAWNDLDETASSATNSERLDAALKQFLDTDPPDAARANAEFKRLRVLTAAAPPGEAISQWLEFRTEGAPLSESGIPLSSLAVAKALQCARQTGPSEALWNGLVREVQSVPSSFTPMLLELAEPLVQTRPELQACLQALKLRWQATERAWDAADAIRCSGCLRGVTTTNFWLNLQGRRWLCLLQPAQSWTETGAGTITNHFTQARLVPKAAVEQAFRTVLQASRVSLPDYLKLEAELEGEPLSPITPGAMPARTEDKPAVAATLAQAEGRLTCPATVANRLEPASHTAEFESLPGHPRYVLRLDLANRAMMFAAQRRRTRMYGALVLAAALTSAVGFGAAYRSFHRQLRLNDMKSNFVSSVSHELRAPIASVRLMAESLERGKITEQPKQHEYFRFIGQECRRLSSLIENVLDFSRIEQGRKQYEFEPTDLVELTRHTVQLMDTYAAERGVKLALALPDPLPRRSQTEAGLPRRSQAEAGQPSIDGKAIQQALINLIDNALKHSPKGQTVTVGLSSNTNPQTASSREALNLTQHAARSTQHAARLALWVEDHGPGIPASEHERIFERFYRLGSELRRDTQGVGIGLSIVKHVVEAHGGRVQVRSAPGQGSRFTIELPLE